MSTVPISLTEVSHSPLEKDELSLDDKDAVITSQTEFAQTASERWRWFWQRRSAEDLDAIATVPSVFDDLTTLEVYRPPSSYENAHRFDPAARWTKREEMVRRS